MPTARRWGIASSAMSCPIRDRRRRKNRVWRLALFLGLQASHHRRRGKGNKPGPAVHDDLLGVVDDNGGVTYDFSTIATGSDQVWLTDITEHWTAGEGKLYLYAVKDCWSNKIVGYSIDTRMKSELAAAALQNAIILRAPVGTIVHSDRSSQFRSKKVVRLLKNNGLRGSMGRVGSSSDNAAIESFFSLLQKNVLNTRRWNTREELRLAIVIWIEKKYNRRPGEEPSGNSPQSSLRQYAQPHTRPRKPPTPVSTKVWADPAIRGRGKAATKTEVRCRENRRGFDGVKQYHWT